MNRDDALTETAMEVAPDQWGDDSAIHYREFEYGWNEYQQRRAELINEPPDSEAPEWARWKAQGANGTWYWCESKPTMSELGIVTAGRVKTSKGCSPAGHNWQKTLREVNQDMIQNEPVKSRNEPQYDPRDVAFNREMNPSTSSITDSQARQAAEETQMCSDGQPCGQDDYCDDCPNAPHAQDARRLDAQLRDAINPCHYRQGGIECIDAIKAATVGKTGIEAACVANVIKYLWRYEEKNGVEDIEKALWYINRLHDEVHD